MTREIQAPDLYTRYYIETGSEVRGLFRLAAGEWSLRRGLYPGSFVHITPSFFIPSMTYVDSDRRIPSFFGDDDLLPYIESEKVYEDETSVSWYRADFRSELPLDDGCFDSVFSFYSGFVSRYCARYLKPGGVLIANDSHGDATTARFDPGFRLAGVIKRTTGGFRISGDEPETYFLKRDGSPVDLGRVLKRMKGEKYTRSAWAYIFRKL